LSVTFINAGARGNTGSIAGGALNTGLTHAADGTIGFDSGLARKVAFLLEDGSLTFDYIRNFEVFKPADFIFSATSFITNIGTQLVGNNPLNLVGKVASVVYNLGPPATASIQVDSSYGTGFPVFFATGAMNEHTFSAGKSITSVAGYSNSSPTAVGTVTFRLMATGGATSGTFAQSTSTVSFLNHVVRGATTATSITAAQLTGGMLAHGFVQSIQQTKASSYNLSAPTDNYDYFAYPSRMGDIITLSVGNVGSGGMTKQGQGDVPGTFVQSYTNNAGYTENYNFYRVTQSGLSGAAVVLT